MAVSVAATFVTQQVTLTGSLTVVPPPSNLSVYEVWVTSAATFNFANSASSAPFPVAAGDTTRLPVAIGDMDIESGKGLYLSGSTTAYIAWLGLPSVSNYTNS